MFTSINILKKVGFIFYIVVCVHRIFSILLNKNYQYISSVGWLCPTYKLFILYLYMYLYINLYIYLSIYLSIYLCLSIYLSIYLSIFLPIQLSNCLINQTYSSCSSIMAYTSPVRSILSLDEIV